MHLPRVRGPEDVELPSRVVFLTERAWRSCTSNRDHRTARKSCLPSFFYWGSVLFCACFSRVVGVSNCFRSPIPKSAQEEAGCDDPILLRRSSDFARPVLLDRLHWEGPDEQ